MTDSATTKELTRPVASFARRYGLAFALVAGALLLDLLFHHFNLPHPFVVAEEKARLFMRAFLSLLRKPLRQ
jgi:hypothetical protein